MAVGKRSGAGSLSERVKFQERVGGLDEYGNELTTWQDRATVAARIRPRHGGEEVMSGRLQGIQPYTMTVRSSTQTRDVTPAWRAVNARTGAVYNIKTVTNPDERGAMLEMLVIEGEAT